MSDPITYSASAIATLAFQQAIDVAGLKTGHPFEASAHQRLNMLRQKIMDQMKGDETIAVELIQAETGNLDAIETVGNALEMMMRESPEFAVALQQLANEINSSGIEEMEPQAA